jgi:hypothetical protein
MELAYVVGFDPGPGHRYAEPVTLGTDSGP